MTTYRIAVNGEEHSIDIDDAEMFDSEIQEAVVEFVDTNIRRDNWTQPTKHIPNGFRFSNFNGTVEVIASRP